MKNLAFSTNISLYFENGTKYGCTQPILLLPLETAKGDQANH